MSVSDPPRGAERRQANARRRFTLGTGIEPDYHSFARSEMAVAGYRGPFPHDTTFVAIAGPLLDPLLDQAGAPEEDTAHRLARLASSDRLLIGWDVHRAHALAAARMVHVDGLTGWHLTWCIVDSSSRRVGLMRHLLRVLVQEEPVDFLSAFVPVDGATGSETLDGSPIHRLIRSLCPGSVIEPDRHGDSGERYGRIVGSVPEQLGSNDVIADARLVVGDLSGVIAAPRRWAEAVQVNERARVVVVTGTNGKTSTVEYGRQLSEAAGSPSASFGTLGVVTSIGRLRRPRIAVGSRALPELAERLWATGTETLWAEGFSFALQEGLLDQLGVDVAAFTQVGSDHLGSHRSLVGYWASKERLFRSVVRPGGVAVVDPTAAGADRILDIVGQRGLDLVTTGPAGDVELGSGHLRVHDRRLPWPISIPQTVMHQNLQLAIGCCVALGIDVARIVDEIGSLVDPPGRFGELDLDTPYRVVIDSAHNADALEASLSQLRRETSGRLLVLIASVGSADETRWEPLGEVAAVLADVVVVSDESPYRGNADRIRAAIRRGCPRSVDIADRRAAIGWLLAQAEPGDVVMIAGRADEDFVIDTTGTIPFPTDARLVAEALRATPPPTSDHGAGSLRPRSNRRAGGR